MLVTDQFIGEYWCFEESDTTYWYYSTNKLKTLCSTFKSRENIANRRNILLGPVCLGFWRG